MHLKTFVFNMVEENTYLIYDDKKNAILIDCGAYTSDEQSTLVDFIESNELRLKHVLNTHLHFDHIMGNHFIYEQYGLRPEYNEKEESMPGMKEEMELSYYGIKFKPVRAEHYIHENDEIVVGNIRLEAILTPGHSPGSLSFYSKENHCVFTGDALFQHSIGRTDLWGGNQQQLVSSIQKKLLTLPDNTIVYPGHGPSTIIGNEKKYNPYL